MKTLRVITFTFYPWLAVGIVVTVLAAQRHLSWYWFLAWIAGGVAIFFLSGAAIESRAKFSRHCRPEPKAFHRSEL